MKMHKKTKPKKILLIERDNTLRDSLEELLTFEGYEVFEAANGYLGLQVAKKYLPDLIICSRLSPDLSCWEIVQQLKTEESTNQIPFIFLSSKPAGEEHQKMTEEVELIVLTKPFEIDEFLTIILKCTSTLAA